MPILKVSVYTYNQAITNEYNCEKGIFKIVFYPFENPKN